MADSSDGSKGHEPTRFTNPFEQRSPAPEVGPFSFDPYDSGRYQTLPSSGTFDRMIRQAAEDDTPRATPQADRKSVETNLYRFRNTDGESIGDSLGEWARLRF